MKSIRRLLCIIVAAALFAEIILDLSRLCASANAGLSHLSFKSVRAVAPQCLVSASWIVKAVDVFKTYHFN